MLDWFVNSKGKSRIRTVGVDAVLVGTKLVRCRTGPNDNGFVIGKVVSLNEDESRVCVVVSNHELSIESNGIERSD